MRFMYRAPRFRTLSGLELVHAVPSLPLPPLAHHRGGGHRQPRLLVGPLALARRPSSSAARRNRASSSAGVPLVLMPATSTGSPQCFSYNAEINNTRQPRFLALPFTSIIVTDFVQFLLFSQGCLLESIIEFMKKENKCPNLAKYAIVFFGVVKK
jgi:hypothetical protein